MGSPGVLVLIEVNDRPACERDEDTGMYVCFADLLCVHAGALYNVSDGAQIKA